MHGIAFRLHQELHRMPGKVGSDDCDMLIELQNVQECPFATLRINCAREVQ
jgi:hypothetical protein